MRSAVRPDRAVLKELNQKLKPEGVRLKFWYYDVSPFTEADKRVIPIILSHTDRLHSDKNKIFLLSALGVRGYDEAVPLSSTSINFTTTIDIRNLLTNCCFWIYAIRLQE